MLFWEVYSAGLFRQGNPSVSGLLFGLPFVVYGQYIIWGRFFYAAWKKNRTFYAVTTRRVIAVQQGWQRQIASTYDLDRLPTLKPEAGPNGTGTLRFAQWEMEHPGARQLGWTRFDVMAIGTVPTFIDIDSVNSVYQLVSDLRKKAFAQRAKS